MPSPSPAALTWINRTLVAVGVAALVALAVVAARGCGGDSSAPAFDFHSDTAPAEYLYLDLSRVRAYLSQIEGGVASVDKQVRSVGSSSGLGLAVSGVTGQLGNQRQLSSERVVTATGASLFLGLRDQLARRAQITVIDAGRRPAAVRRAIAGVPEGGFVELQHVRLRVPKYMLPYLVLRYPAKRTTKALIQLEPAERAPVRHYLQAVGDDPRLMLRWPATRSPFTLLLPVRYGSLTDEWSLYQGGSTTIVGKITRRVVAEGDFYRDIVVRSEFERSAALLPPRALASFVRLRPADLRRSLDDSTDLTGGITDGAVLLPVAVFT